MLEFVAGVELLKKVFTSRARLMSLIVELNIFTKMLCSRKLFHLLKHSSLLNLLNLKSSAIT
jgi:hypothetical protein